MALIRKNEVFERTIILQAMISHIIKLVRKLWMRKTNTRLLNFWGSEWHKCDYDWSLTELYGSTNLIRVVIFYGHTKYYLNVGLFHQNKSKFHWCLLYLTPTVFAISLILWSGDAKSGDLGHQFWNPTRPIHQSRQWTFKYSRTLWRKCAGAQFIRSHIVFLMSKLKKEYH